MTRYTPLWEQAGTYPASLDRRLLGSLWPGAAIIGGAVTPGTAMQVSIAPGTVAIPLTSGAGSVLCNWDAVELVALNAAPGAGLNRIDLIYAQARANDIDSGSNNDFIFAALAGTAAASPVVPSPLPNNAVAIAQVYVPAQSASVTAANITQLTAPNLAIPPQRVPAGRLWANAQTVIATGVAGKIALQVTDYLYGGMTVVTGGLIVPVAGIYRVSCAIAWQSGSNPVGASVTAYVLAYLNGVQTRQWGGGANWASFLLSAGADDIKCNAGDRLDLYAMQNTGAAAGSFPATYATFLSAHLVSTGP